MKTYIFEKVQREEVTAVSEEEAWVWLAGRCVVTDDFELIDVWNAEEPNANAR